MNMPTLLKLKVKTKLFAKKLIGNSVFQLFLIALILLPFAFLNLKGWYELLYVIFGLVLFLIFFASHDKDYFYFYFSIAIILFIIALFFYIPSAVFITQPPHPITNPLINFFIFFSFDFLLSSIIYNILNG